MLHSASRPVAPGPAGDPLPDDDLEEGSTALRAQARLAAIVESTDDAIISKDLNGIVLTWNPAAERLLGYSHEEIVGRPIQTIIPLERRDEETEILRRIRAGQRVDHFETRRRTKSGTLLDVSITVSPVRGADGRIVGASKILRDITRQRQIEQALRDANAKLVEADRRKDEFLAMLSHELRNPLAPLSNSLLLLEHAEPGAEKARRAREVMRRQVSHLTRIVDDLLDVTRIARGRIELRRAELDLAQLVARTAEDHRGVMQAKGIALEIGTPRGPVRVNGDEVRLGQVVGNLLHNAVKFTDPGGRIALAVTTSGGSATVSVRDTGAGMEADLLAAVFKPFAQGEQSLARSRGGLGLGLALVKGLVELHGGTVEATSPGLGRGSELTFHLPLQPPTPAAPPTQPEANPAEAARRPSVLIVDDNRDAADTLAELLSALGHEVCVAYDGPGGLEQVARSRPDIVLCDIGLPGMTGYEVARRLRTGGGPALRLVALSGYAAPEDVRKAMASGFDAHLAKPVDLTALERAMVGPLSTPPIRR